MKKYFLLIIAIVAVSVFDANAQTPAALNYQGIARTVQARQ